MSAFSQHWNRPLRGLLVTAAAAALVACGGDDGSTPDSSLSGVAAVGSPIVGGTVDVACAGGTPLNTTTSTTGAWQVTLSGQTLPCAVQVTGGTVDGVANPLSLHSVAFDIGNVNVSTLTELVMANGLRGSPQTWFAAPDFAALTAAKIDAALVQITSKLGIAAALAGKDPLTAEFQPKAGDTIDDLLEALGAALKTLGTDFAALLAAAAADDFEVEGLSGLSGAIATALGGGQSGGSCTSGVEMTYTLSTAGGPYANQQKVCVEASATSLSIGGKTLTNPTVNSTLQPPFAGYTFVDGSYSYEVILNNGALYEINFLGANFLGQFTPSSSSGSGVTLTVEVNVSGSLATSFSLPDQTAPTSQDEFCAGAASDPSLNNLGVTLTITGCSFANNVGTIQATATVSGLSVPYVVKYTWGG